MKPAMFDLVAKSQGKVSPIAMSPSPTGEYRYKNRLRTIHQLSAMSGIAASTLHSRFQRGTYTSVEEVVDTPVKYRRK